MQQTFKRLSFAISALFCISVEAQLPAFPGAQGFGAYAVGGRGGDVYTVVNLNSSGEGSLAYGIENAPSGGRTIVFAVSGYIHVPGGNLRIVKNNITIAGQTAPGDGIGLKDGTVRITGNNVVVRHIRIRHGKYGSGGDCLNLDSSAHDSIIDHVSMMFSTDENISFFNSSLDNFTMQYSTSSWGMERHNAGGLWDMQDGSCHHSLWAHHRTRNPKARPSGLLEWINNVTYHWRSEGFIMGDSETPINWSANVLGCYFLSIDDPDEGFGLKNTALSKARIASNGLPNFHLYLADCLHDADGDGLLNGTDKGYAIVDGDPYDPGEGAPAGTVRYDQASTPFAGASGSAAVTVDDPLTAYKKVLASAGALRLDASHTGSLRDELDSLLIESVENQESILVQKDGVLEGETTPSNGEAHLAEEPYNISNAGFGTLTSSEAPLDTDGDGMPDYWELSTGSTLLQANQSGSVPAGAYISDSPAGYTLLEEYLHFKAIPHAVIPKRSTTNPSSIAVDLRRYTRGFQVSPFTFTITNITGGSAVIQPDGYTAIFEPTIGFSGRARFDFTVLDGDGSSWTQTFAVLVDATEIPDNLVWQGDGTLNLWDESTLNFLDGGTPSAFGPFDNLRFDDTGSRTPAVQVTGILVPGGVEVETDLSYTFAGSGTLEGAMTLVKKGAGSLTIANSGPNTFSGGTSVHEGTLVVGASGALGGGFVALASHSVLQLGSYSLSSGNPLIVSGWPAIIGGNGGGLTDIHAINGSGTIHIESTSVIDLAGDISGFDGTLAFAGNRNIRFLGCSGGADAYFDLGDGSLNLSKRSTLGTVTLGALSGGSGTVLQGATGGGNTSVTTYCIGDKGIDTTFDGTVVNGGGITHLLKVGSGKLELNGANTYTGDTTVDAGTLGGSGRIAGSVEVSSAARCAPGSGGAGTLTIGGDLVLNATTLVFDLSRNPVAGNDRIQMEGGLLDLNGNQTFEFNLLDGELSEGTYMLIDGAGNSDAAGVGFIHNLSPFARQVYNMQRPASGTGAAYVRLVVQDVDPIEPVAWYRFEEGSAGSGVPSGVHAVMDTAGGDDNMNAYNTSAAPAYNALAPGVTVPQSGDANRLSLLFDGGDDVYNSVTGPLRTTAFGDITVEAFVRFTNIDGFQTIVGRDDSWDQNGGQNSDPHSLFYLQKRAGDNIFRVVVCTAGGDFAEVNSSAVATTGVWYHLAAVGDVSAGTLTLYVDGSPVGSASGYDGLFVPAENNGWTIGRGQYYGYVADKVTGYIDEVRITAGALAPGYFLCVFNPDFDDDGLVDAWEREHFGNLDQVASGDPDKDGLTNEEEQNNDTDPTVSNAPYLGLTLEQGLLHFSWPVDSTGWVLEYRTNLVGVSPGVGWTAVPGSAATNLFSIPMDSVSGNKAFFHLREPE